MNLPELDLPTVIIIVCGVYGVYALAKGFFLLRKGAKERQAAQSGSGRNQGGSSGN